MAEALKLRGSRGGYGLLVSGMCAAFVLRIWWEDHGPGRWLPWWDWLLIVPALAGLAWGLAFLLWPPQLTIDDDGTAFDMIGYHRRIAWTDIERVGIATKPVGDLTTRYMRSTATEMVNAPKIGIDYKAGRNPISDPGKIAYRKGFFGYDVAWNSHSSHSLTWIVERMSERLQAARLEC